MKIQYVIKPFGEAALLVEFEQKISPFIHDLVLGLNEAVVSSKIVGVDYTVPAYCSLSIVFSPTLISYNQLQSKLEQLLSDLNSAPSLTGKLHKIPICYQEEFGPDLAQVCQITGLNRKEVIQLHCQEIYRVYMIGFLPGFPYLGLVSPKLQVARLSKPRIKVPAGSVGLAGQQTGIYPSEAPGGWQIIGRTNVLLFDPKKKNPALFSVGDQVQFYEVNQL